MSKSEPDAIDRMDDYTIAVGRLRALMHVYQLANTAENPNSDPLIDGAEHDAIGAMAAELFNEVDAAVQSVYAVAVARLAPVTAEASQ